MRRSHSRSPPVRDREYRDRARDYRDRDRDRDRRRRDRDGRDDRRDHRDIHRDERRDPREDKRDRDRDPRDDRKERDFRADKDESKYASRRRSRSPIQRRERRRSPEGGSSTSGGDSRQSGSAPTRNAVPDFLMERKPISEEDLANKDEEEIAMMKLMGFGGFESTKGKKVPGNDVSGVHVIQKRKYRQYMNRKGGFNRPLDFVA